MLYSYFSSLSFTSNTRNCHQAASKQKKGGKKNWMKKKEGKSADAEDANGDAEATAAAAADGSGSDGEDSN